MSNITHLPHNNKKLADTDTPVKKSAELRFAESLQKDGQYRRKNGCLVEWDDTAGFWKILDPQYAESAAWTWLVKNDPANATAKRAASLVSSAILATPELSTQEPDGGGAILPLRNGYLHIVESGVELRDPDPICGLSYQINANFNPEAQCPGWDKFLHEVIEDGDTRSWLQEWCGASLLPHARYQEALILYGIARSGKSVIAEVAAALHREVAAPDLKNLGNGFTLTTLLSASLVWIDEMDKKFDEQLLKKLISGGLVEVNRKYRDPIRFRPDAKWLFCTNLAPATLDSTFGFWRRLATISFAHSIPRDKVDPHLAERLKKEELDGILLWALRGLMRVLERGSLSPHSQEMEQTSDELKQETNSVAAWWAEHEIKFDQHSSVTRDAAYAWYQFWAKNNGFSPVKSPTFWARVREIEPQVPVSHHVPQTRAKNGKPQRLALLSGGGLEDAEDAMAALLDAPGGRKS